MIDLKPLLDLAQHYWVVTLAIALIIASIINRSVKTNNLPKSPPPPAISSDKFRRALNATEASARTNNSSFGVPDEGWEEVLEALRKNNKIQAIKLVREAKGLGLAEAKDFVENLERNIKQLNSN